MLTSIEALLEVQLSDYDANLSVVEHTIKCYEPPTTTLRLHFIKPDGSGEPRFRDFARVLARYITHYCFKAERRRSLSETEHNELYMQARDLFRRSANSGQVGELLIYFLLETVLKAPQALKKMLITTNPKEERKGSDGVHLRWDTQSQMLEIIFAESKLWQSFHGALSDAFSSIDAFHESRTRNHEINIFTSGFSTLSEEMQRTISSYIEGENSSKCRLVQACLIGFDWAEYACLTDQRRSDFIKEFDERYRAWAVEASSKLNDKLQACKQKHLRFEFFMLPFVDVEAFRSSFIQNLMG